MQMLLLLAFFGLMYFLLIRPQRKKEKQINEMRNSVGVGDEVITIGGICGKIVKTKDDSLVIQVGADKVKFEIMRWAISQVVAKGKKGSQVVDDVDEDDEPVSKRRSSPRRLKKADSESDAKEEAKDKAEDVKKEAEEVSEKADEAAEKAAEDTEK